MIIIDPVIEQKVNDLLKQMTIEEKAGQVNESGLGPYEKFVKSKTGLGHLVCQQGNGVNSEQAAERANQLQKMAIENSRLKIPLLIVADGIHDARVSDAVTFPQEIGMGSTWNPELVEKIYSVISREMRAVGYGRTFAPNVGISRDPRFGRTGEIYSEDTYLTTRMSVAAVKGLMGESLKTGIMATLKHYAAYDATIGGKDSSAMDISERSLREVYLPPFKEGIDSGAGAIMCAYHAVNGVPCASNSHLLIDILKKEWGFNGFVCTDYMCIESLFNNQHVVNSMDEAIKLSFESGVDVHDHDLGDDFAVKMAELVKKGYISEAVLDKAVRRILRAKFKLGLFENPYVDPQKAVTIVGCEKHRQTALESARESMVLLKNEGNILPLKKEINSIAVIGPNADSIKNQLGVWVKVVIPKEEQKITTILQGIRNKVSPGTKVYYAKGCDVRGFFQPIPESFLATVTQTGEQQGLKGEYFNNKDLTGEPVSVRVDKNIDFDWKDGVLAKEVNAGNFSVRWTGKLTVPVAGKYRLKVTADDGIRIFLDNKLIVDKWECWIPLKITSLNLRNNHRYDIRVEHYKSDRSRLPWEHGKIHIEMECPGNENDSIAEAVEIAKKSDVAIVVVGDCPEMNAETNDRADLNLAGNQDELVRAVHETGIPTVVVLINARPLTINYIAEEMPAILEAWNPGEQGGNAVAEVLFGEYNPGGKLPITFPRSAGQLPIYYNYEPGWHGGQYACGTDSKPLFQFGYGLSYTKFEYSNIRLASGKIPVNGKAEISIDVKNTGECKGDEVVQLYIHDVIASVVRTIKELKGFKRITLEPGEKKTVGFTLLADQLAFCNREMKRVVEPGAFDVMVGGNSVDVKTIKLEVE